MIDSSPIKSLISATPGITISDSASYYGGKAPGLPLLLIRTHLLKAVISIQGAQLLEFTPCDSNAPLLWLSPKARFDKGKAIRGGIPICLPWFGVPTFEGHNTMPKKPKHGFARTQLWQLTQASCKNDGHCNLKFIFSNNKETVQLYPFQFSAELEVSLSQSIKLGLTVHNRDKQTIPVSLAFHSYHPVDSLKNTQVTGLENTHYLDNTRDLKKSWQDGAITFPGEVDRVYENINTEQIIKSKSAIGINANNCPTAIIWNPGAEVAATMTDIGKGNYQSFICVERGAAFSDSWKIPSGEKRVASVKIQSCP